MADLKVQGLVEIITRMRGADATQADLRELEQRAKDFGFRLKNDASPAVKKLRKDAKDAGIALEKMGKQAKKAGSGVSSLGASLVQFVSLGLLFRTAQQSVLVFAEYERQLRAIGLQLTALGISAEAATPPIDNFLQALETSSGVLRQDAATAFQKFLGITNDVNAAMLLTKTAAGAANSGIAEFGNAANLIGSIIQGEVIEPSKSLGIAFDQTTDSAQQQAEVLEKVIEKYIGLADAQDDSQSSVDTITASWNEFKTALGEGLAPVLRGVARIFSGLTKTIKSLGPITAKSFFAIVGGAKGLLLALKGFSLRKLLTGDLSGIRDDMVSAFQVGLDSVKLEMEGADDELAAIWEDHGKTSAESFEKGRQAVLEQAAARARAKAKAEAEKAAAEEQKRQEELAERRIAFEQATQDRILQEKLRLVEEGSVEEFRLQQQILERMRERAIEHAEAVGADVALVKEQFRLAEEALEIEFIERREDRLEKHHERMLKQWGLFWKRVMDGAKKEGDDREDKAKKAAAIEEEQRRAAVDQAVELARTAFGNTKAFAIAETIVNTARGVMSALGMTPPNIPLAALIAATGALQLAKIRSTNFSGGGGGGGVALGSGGAAAVQLPRPGVPEQTVGVSQIIDPRGDDRRGDVHLTFQGINVVDRTTLRKLKRELDSVDRGRPL